MSREATSHLQSTRRVLAAAAPEHRLKAFRLMASEATRLISARHAAKADMVDALHAIAREAELGDDDLITAEIAEALLHPLSWCLRRSMDQGQWSRPESLIEPKLLRRSFRKIRRNTYRTSGTDPAR